MSPLVTPNPYPGCEPCGTLVREWVAVTEPASPEFDRDRADTLAARIGDHRRLDEDAAPAL